MAMTLAALKTEIQTDPQTYGYAAHVAAGEPELIAEKLNKVRDGTDGEAAITLRRADISPQELWGAISVADYTALPGNPTAAQLSTERRYLSWLTGLSAQPKVRLLNDDGSDGPVIANLNAMFGAGTGTRNRIAALANRFGSRAEQLFGADTVVSIQDVSDALRQ